jgi:hypothetical protein
VKLGKIVAWIITAGLLLLIVYAVTSDLSADVVNPFTPPRP